MAITETKGTPPTLEGYAPWYHRPRSEGDGGGVAITVRNDINQNTQLVDDLENNNNQEIIWIQINLNRRNKIYAGVYYGKQENTPADEVEREMSQLRAQITKLRPKGHIILTGDFNAKININQEEAKQSASRNGIKLEETLEDLQLTAISTKSKTGTWTRVPWNKKETKSVIDYIVIKKEDAKLVTDNTVDEAESIKIQGTNKSDHNTLCLTLKIPHTNESTTITRWKLKNEEGWKYFNEELRKIETEGQLSYNQMEKSIKCILEKTIGKTRIKTNRPSRGKETETIKALRKDLGEKRKAFNTATRKNKNKHESMKAYIQSQAKLKEGIEKEHRENIRDLAKRISKEGGTKSQLFWKEKRRITPKQSSNSHITLNESGHPIEDPAEAKEHIAQYFENLYQAREGRPQYAEWTKEIKTTIRRITESDEMKEDINPISTTETRQIRTHVLRIPPAVTSQAKMKNWLHECQKWVSHMIGQYAHI